jgi:hypothetical protein
MKLFKNLINVLAFACLSVSAYSQGVTPVGPAFTAGSVMVITNGATVSYGDTNVFFVNGLAPANAYSHPTLTGRWSLANSNFVATTGQNGTNYIPLAAYFTNAAAFNSTNALAGGYVNNTNVFNGLAWGDIPGWANLRGDVGSGCLSCTVIGIGSRAADVAGAPTNNITLTFSKSVDGVNFGTDVADRLVWGFSGNCVTNGVHTTNFTSAFFTGAKKIRLEKIVLSSVASGTNVVFGPITAFGWQ